MVLLLWLRWSCFPSSSPSSSYSDDKTKLGPIKMGERNKTIIVVIIMRGGKKGCKKVSGQKLQTEEQIKWKPNGVRQARRQRDRERKRQREIVWEMHVAHSSWEPSCG